ncbi:MAG: AMP-binding protein [Streptosporangiaceae bacterium]
MGFDDFVSTGRSDLKITPRSDGDLAIVGYTSGTTGLPKGAMISQRALTECVRLMPSLFRISSYGRCAFTGTLSFVSGIFGERYIEVWGMTEGVAPFPATTRDDWRTASRTVSSRMSGPRSRATSGRSGALRGGAAAQRELEGT